MNRIVTSIIISLSFISIVDAKDLDYDDIMESMKTSKDFEIYQTLFDYQKSNPLFANTYYQLGIICQKWMRQYDPFLQSAIVEENVKNAKLFFSLCVRYCDEKDARKNGKYYQGAKLAEVDDDPSLEAIHQDIMDRLQEVENFQRYYNEDLTCLVNSVTKYNLCISLFKEINYQNSRLKDLYFLTDDSVLNNLNKLQTNFDSALYYFRRLKTSLSEFPLGNFNPDYLLAPVQVYRLHGLTSANFLNNSVVLWNFGEWVTSFKKILESEIAVIKQKAIETDKQNTKYIESLSNKDLQGFPDNFKVNPGLLNKMLKYDFKSTAAKLLIYQESKIYFLYHYAKNSNVVKDSLGMRLSTTNPDYYFQLIGYKHNTDSLLNFLKQDTSKSETDKYSELFTKHYGGFTGFGQYLEKQKSLNDSILNSSFNQYKNNIMAESVIDTTAKMLLFNKKVPVNLNITRPDLIKGEGYYTFYKTVTPENQVIITGSVVAKNAEVSAFAAVIDTFNNIKWLKTYKPNNGAQYGVMAQQLNDGVLLTLVSKTKKSQSVNILIVDTAGNIKTSKELKTLSVPRKILYDDISQSTLIVVKGNDYGKFAESEDSMSIYMLDAALNVLWSKKIWFNGYLANVLKVNNQFYIYGSYNKLTAPDGKTYNLDGQIYNSFLSIIDASGNYIQTNTYPLSSSYFPLRIVKINSDFIDVISVKDMKPKEAILNADSIKTNPHYYITTSKGDTYFSF